MATVSAIPVSSSGQPPPSAAQPSEEAQANKEMFLKLLVAQLQNQNPASPADPIQFLTQLTQFTTLEQTIAMRQELEAIHAALAQAGPAQQTTAQE